MDTTNAQDAILPSQADAPSTTIESQSTDTTAVVAPPAKDQTPSSESTNPKSDNPHWKPRAPRMVGPDGQLLSRNATKKLIKQQEFLERKPLMKQQEKLKRKKKQQERREAIEKGLIEPKRRKLDPTQSGITIGIDMSFDDHMLDKEVKSMVDQIKRCYSFNKGCDKIVHLALTSFTGKSRVEFAKRAHGFELWRNFTYHDESLEKVWPSAEIPGKERMESIKKLQAMAAEKSEAAKAKALAAQAAAAAAGTSEGSSQTEQPITVDSPAHSLTEAEIKALEQERFVREENLATIPAVNKIVYLSADSPNTITQLDPGTCYVMGGIVDKNRYPFLCQNKAEALGIETAQLPIGEYIQMSSRRVLTVNQVFEILLHFIECNDWKEAFLKVIPQRKLEEKQRIRRGTAAWREKYGSEGKSRPSNSGANSVASGDDNDEDDEDEDENSYNSDEEGNKGQKDQDGAEQEN
ncbi:tRNA (guanine9-N1)-methyltransferase [Entomortierella parvispora]|uniref:tRNA (guanine(9)-N1)-methyltransferase n=1 Tax=Entomortierella parvispora TaxID=205924 RepID=A0A9P3HAU8_9FUNG|nr:tRNA (guanine9-N1)-methyltransferase [Entomortierella parvispora]